MTEQDPWDAIAAAFSLIGRATAALPFVSIPDGQRRALAGRIFPDGAPFVLRVAAALAEEPDRFADAPVPAAELLHHQRAAQAWALLLGRLQRLTQLCTDAFLFHQSEAIRKALLVTERVQALARLPSAPAGDGEGRRNRDRQLALLPALLVVHAYHQSLQQQKMKKKDQEPAAPPSRSRAAGARQDQAQARRRADMFRLFAAWEERRLQELEEHEPGSPPAACSFLGSSPDHESEEESLAHGN